MRNPKSKIEVAIAKAVEPVGSMAAELLEDASKGKYLKRLGALQAETKLSDSDIDTVVNLAVTLELRAAKAIALLLQDPTFREALVEELVPEKLRAHTAKRQKIRTSAIEQAVAANPSTSTKQILRNLEAQGKYIDRGDHYEYAGTGKRVRKSSISSKVSRLRKAMRDA